MHSLKKGPLMFVVVVRVVFVFATKLCKVVSPIADEGERPPQIKIRIFSVEPVLLRAMHEKCVQLVLRMCVGFLSC